MNTEQIIEKLKQYESLSLGFRKKMASYRSGRQIRVFMSRIFWLAASVIAVLLLFLLTERTPAQSELLRYIASVFSCAFVGFWLIKAFEAIIKPPETTEMAVEIEEATGKFNSGL